MAAPAPVALPSLDYKIDLPTPIVTAIPTAADVVAADGFRRLVSTIGADSGAGLEAQKAAIVYEHRVVRAAAAAPGGHANGGPPVDARLEQLLAAKIDRLGERLDRRIEQLSERLDRTDQRIEQLDRHFDQLNQRVGDLEGVTTKGYVRAAKLENLLYQDDNHLVEVPFPDGTFPWGKEVPGPSKTRVVLPELKSIGAVKTLSAPQLYGFCRGYYPSEQLPRDGSRCREMILAAIGRGRDAHLL